MGCTSTRSRQRQNSNIKPQGDNKPVPEVNVLSSKKLIQNNSNSKITVAEAQKKRQDLRKNLDEGEYNPPKMQIPQLQLIQTQ